MRTLHALVVALVFTAVGCAGQQRTHRVVYACDSGAIAPLPLADPSILAVGSQRATRTGADAAGDHYVLVTGDQVLDYVLPRDVREDATVWETSSGGRLLRERCTARGGHTDLLTRWIDGQGIGDIGLSLGIQDAEVRDRLRQAILWMVRRTRRGDGALPARLMPTLAHR